MTLHRFRTKKIDDRYKTLSHSIRVGKLYFRSFRQACLYFKVDRCTAKQRLDKGWSIEEALALSQNKNKIFIVNNKEFSCFKQACINFGLNRGTVKRRLAIGWTIDEAFELSSRNTNPVCNGFIYLITNSKNKKVYVGLTTSELEKRLYQHKIKAIKGSKTKLHVAMRLIGIDNFKINIIKKIKYKKDLNKYEIKYIKKYDSIISGYNTSKGGGSVGDKIGTIIIHKNKTYYSKTALAKSLNISLNALNYRIKNKILFDRPVNNSHKAKRCCS